MGYFDFSVPNFFGESPVSQDMGGAGVLAPQQGTSWDIPYVEEVPWYSQPTLLPGGSSTEIPNRSNNTWWGMSQEKITSSLSDVLGSVVQAGAKAGIQYAAGTMNTAANGKPSGWQSFANNFRSTATGAQINAGAQAFSFQNFVSNPVVWFGAVAVIVLFFVLRK